MRPMCPFHPSRRAGSWRRLWPRMRLGPAGAKRLAAASGRVCQVGGRGRGLVWREAPCVWAWHGMGIAWHGMRRHGVRVAWHGMTWHVRGMEWHAGLNQLVTWWWNVKHGVPLLHGIGMAWHGMGMAWHGMTHAMAVMSWWHALLHVATNGACLLFIWWWHVDGHAPPHVTTSLNCSLHCIMVASPCLPATCCR